MPKVPKAAVDKVFQRLLKQGAKLAEDGFYQMPGKSIGKSEKATDMVYDRIFKNLGAQSPFIKKVTKTTSRI